MKQNKRIIAVFDFDGTISTKDTFIVFIKYAFGEKKFYYGFLVNCIWIILMLINLYPRAKAKQRIFSWFFKDMNYSNFKELGYNFTKEIDKIINLSTLEILNKHINNKDTVYVISASIKEWIHPWCIANGITNTICTQIEINEKNKLTGCFSTLNCSKKEKVNRLIQIEPNRNDYILYAYGDSDNDKEILEFADYSLLINKNNV